ncbi:uncharacterized protein [Hyperolius riggenbachi]|uniref:uncharacterized protein isoform X2 n=1 Tax=Hyperolius riggenbachi TaxID=752182 RepID=UPI0035A372DD
MIDSKPFVVSSDISQKRGPGRPPGSKNKVRVIHQKEVKLELHSVKQDGLAMPNKKGPGRPPLIRTKAADIPKIANSKSSTNIEATEETMHSRITVALPETQHEALNIKRKELLVRSRPTTTNNVVLPEKRARRTPFFYGSGIVDLFGKKDHPGLLKKDHPGPLKKDHPGPLKKNHPGPLCRRPEDNNKAEKKSGNPRFLHWSLVKKETPNAVAGQKRRGRPRMSTSLFAKIKPRNVPTIKPKSGPVIGENTKEEKRKAVQRKSHIDRRGAVTKKAGIASVTVLVEEKRRGRPRKVQPGKADQGQITQGMSSPSENPHCSWESGEIMEELDGGLDTREYQYSYCETKPLATGWITEQGEYDALGSPVTHWVVENSADSQVPQQSPLPAQSAPEQSCYRDDFLQELSNFKCQLINELASTRAEIREGAQLVRSAIAGVSAEIHRLGQILQPLVSVITGGSLPWQDPLLGFVPRPQQDTPPDDTMDVMEPSVQGNTSFSQQDQVFASLHSTPTNRSTGEACLVKTEDASTSPPPCIHQAQSAVSTQVDLSTDPTLDLSHQLKACLGKVTSSALETSVNITQPNTDSVFGL